MFLIIKIVNQQYVIDSEKNNVLKVDDSKKDIKIIFASKDDKILTKEEVAKIKLNVEVQEEGFLDKKVISFKKKRRKGYARKKGHRQKYDLSLIHI